MLIKELKKKGFYYEVNLRLDEFSPFIVNKLYGKYSPEKENIHIQYTEYYNGKIDITIGKNMIEKPSRFIKHKITRENFEKVKQETIGFIERL